MHNIAYKYYRNLRKRFEYDELYNEGCMGLLKAIEKYDVTHHSGAAFVTYAVPWIHHYIRKHYKRNYGLIRVPEYRFDKVKI